VGSPAPAIAGATNGIPTIVLSAYRHAGDALAVWEPGCHIPLALLAAIGKVESGHARGGQVSAGGTALRPILGPVLDGTNGTAAIPDTDGGALDGNTVWDMAVGPMRFIPSTWRGWASDGNGDGRADPENVFDAALAAARYPCADGRDLATGSGVQQAILSYNDSASYLRLVSAWMNAYSGAVVEVADVTGPAGAAGPTAPAPAPPVPPTVATTTTAQPPLPPTTTVAPAPPTTTGTTTTAPAQPAAPPPAPPGNPVTGVLCGVQDVLGTGLGLVGGLLGGDSTPQPGCPGTDTGSKG
jgi:hypothetical protein